MHNLGDDRQASQKNMNYQQAVRALNKHMDLLEFPTNVRALVLLNLFKIENLPASFFKNLFEIEEEGKYSVPTLAKLLTVVSDSFLEKRRKNEQ